MKMHVIAICSFIDGQIRASSVRVELEGLRGHQIIQGLCSMSSEVADYGVPGYKVFEAVRDHPSLHGGNALFAVKG